MAFAPRRAQIHAGRTTLDVTIEPNGAGALFTFHTEAARTWIYRELTWEQQERLGFRVDWLGPVRTETAASTNVLLDKIKSSELSYKLDLIGAAQGLPPRFVATPERAENIATLPPLNISDDEKIPGFPPRLLRKVRELRRTADVRYVAVTYALETVAVDLRDERVDKVFREKSVLDYDGGGQVALMRAVTVTKQGPFTIATLDKMPGAIGVTKRGPGDADSWEVAQQVAINRLYADVARVVLP